MFKNFKDHKIAALGAQKHTKPLSKAALYEKIAEKRHAAKAKQAATGEDGGPEGPEPTRYGDWEVGGRVSDF